MKVKADDYFNNGMFEIARFGNSMIQRNIMSEDDHATFIDTLADNLPNTIAEITALIEKIRTSILKCDPIDILSFAQLQSLCSFKGITSESQQIGVEYVSIQRLAEYIQSVFISNPPCNPAEIDDPSELFFEISADYATLNKLIQNYYLELGAKYQKEDELDEELQKNLFEAQMMYSVRGHRYQVFEQEYYEKLLMPHDEVFRSLFGLSAIDVVEGISKLQYALSQGRIDPFNHLGAMYNEFLDADEDKREETIESQIVEGKQLISRFFGTELNDVCSVTGWSDAFVAELSYGLGDDLSFFEHPEYPGWPIINLPIQKRPFIRLNGISYCFDYYSFIDNFYRSLQKTITRLDSSHKWNEIQKEASESMVESVFQKLLPGSLVYRNNFYPKEGSIKNLCENDLRNC